VPPERCPAGQAEELDNQDAAANYRGAVSAWIEKECGIVYESRPGLFALLHRLGIWHRKPLAVSRKLDPDKQAAFISKLTKTS
jgi:transposase